MDYDDGKLRQMFDLYSLGWQSFLFSGWKIDDESFCTLDRVGRGWEGSLEGFGRQTMRSFDRPHQTEFDFVRQFSIQTEFKRFSFFVRSTSLHALFFFCSLCKRRFLGEIDRERE